MMNLGTVDEILDKLKTVLIQDNYSSENLTTITIDWDEGGAVIIEYNSDKSTILIEKEYFESKNDFLQDLINSIKKFSLLNIHASIKVCDCQLSSERPLYETKSCETFYAKVSEYTGLKKTMIFELLMPIFEAEIYFFVRPPNLDESSSRLLITSGSFNSATVNSLYIEMINASEHFENVSFLGKIKNSDHQRLKKIVDVAVRNLLELTSQQNLSEDSFECMQIGLIDLTKGLIEEDQKYHKNPDDETFYDINTSDIMEIDFPLSHFYDPDIKGLKEGWDETVDDDRYINFSYDEEIMSTFLDCLLHDKNEKPIPIWDSKPQEPVVVEKLKRSKSEDDLQIVCVTSTSDSLGRNTGKWKLRQRNNGKVQHPATTRMSLGNYNSKNRATTKVKSNLFNDEEVVKWEKSKGTEDMSKLMLSTSKDYKNLTACLDKDYKIPRKSYNGPSPRPSIHNSKDSKMLKQQAKPNMMHIFQNRVESIVPYDSPSGHRITGNSPESVSNFINVETIHVIDDDEDDNNNKHSTIDRALQKGPAKRRLLSISPKIFKNRRTDYKPYDSLFSSNANRNSTSRRKL